MRAPGGGTLEPCRNRVARPREPDAHPEVRRLRPFEPLAPFDHQLAQLLLAQQIVLKEHRGGIVVIRGWTGLSFPPPHGAPAGGAMLQQLVAMTKPSRTALRVAAEGLAADKVAIGEAMSCSWFRRSGGSQRTAPAARC